MHLEVSGIFGLTGSITDWKPDEPSLDLNVVTLDNAGISQVTIPGRTFQACRIWVTLRDSSSLLILEPNRRELLSALSFLPLSTTAKAPRSMFLRWLENLGLPKLSFEGNVNVRPLWRLEEDNGTDALVDLSVLMFVVGENYDIDWKTFVQSYNDGSFWNNRENDPCLQEVVVEEPELRVVPLGAHITGRNPQALLIGSAWGTADDIDADVWWHIPMIGTSAELIGTPATPPNNYEPLLR